MGMSARLLQLRKKLNLTQLEFAERLEIDRSYVASMEKGARQPSNSLLKLMSHEYGVSVTWLKTGDGEMFLPLEDKSINVKTSIYMRIDSLLKARNIPKSQFSEDIGISIKDIDNWKRSTLLFEVVTLIKIAKYFDVSLDWLMIGHERIAKSEEYTIPYESGRLSEKEDPELEHMIKVLSTIFNTNDTRIKTWASVQFELAFNSKLLKRLLRKPPSKNIHELVYSLYKNDHNYRLNESTAPSYSKGEDDETAYTPIISRIAAGLPLDSQESIDGYLPVPSILNKKDTFLTRVKGDSMTGDDIWDGDIVQIRRQPVVENGEIAAVRVNDEFTLKHVYYHNGKIELRASNPNYQPQLYDPKETQITVIGKLIRKFSKSDVECLIQEVLYN